MAYTYSKIASVTVGSGGVSSIDFLAIPQNYTDLVLKASLRSNFAAETDKYVNLTFNSSNASIYSTRELLSSGATVASLSWSNMAQNYIFEAAAAAATANTFGNLELYIPNYSGSTFKTISNDGVTETNAASGTNRLLSLSASIWANSAAINQITLTSPSSTFNQYSTATLYGIKAEV